MSTFDYILAFIVFPLFVIIPIHHKKDIHVSRESSYYLKGIASILIIFSHYLSQLNSEMNLEIGAFKIYKNWGTLAVAVFFFLSAYGNYFSYKTNNNLSKFLFKFLSIYIPSLIFSILDTLLNGGIKIDNFIGTVTFYSNFWFVFELLIFEITLHISLKIKNSPDVLILFITSMLFTILFFIINEDEYWYSSNLSFVVGYTVAKFEQKRNKKIFVDILRLVIIGIGFIISTVVFMVFDYNRIIILISKNMASVLFVLFIYIVFNYLTVKPNILALLGKTSLYLYIIHLTFLHKAIELNINMSIFLIFSIILSSLFYFIDIEIKKIITHKYRHLKNNN